jgi:hypothetical protein
LADLDLVAIRRELAVALGAIDVLAGVAVYDRVAPGPNLPAVHVGAPTAIVYHAQYASERACRITLTLEVAREDAHQAQRTLDRWLSWPGIAAGLEGYDSAFWSDLHVRGELVTAPTSLGNPDVGEIASLSVDLPVDITT